jgi:hypothetical protein
MILRKILSLFLIPYYIHKDGKKMAEPNNPIMSKEIKPSRNHMISKDFSVEKLKLVSRKLNCTINDLIMTSVGVTFKRYFKDSFK